MRSKEPGQAPVETSNKDAAQRAEKVGKMPVPKVQEEDDLQPLKEKSGF